MKNPEKGPAGKGLPKTKRGLVSRKQEKEELGTFKLGKTTMNCAKRGNVRG